MVYKPAAVYTPTAIEHRCSITKLQSGLHALHGRRIDNTLQDSA
jgi:hypothetical protein